MILEKRSEVRKEVIKITVDGASQAEEKASI